MVRSIRQLVQGLVALPLLAASAAFAVDDPPAPKPGPKPEVKSETSSPPKAEGAPQTQRAASYGLPGEDPPQPFVPLKPRTVEDRERVEALTEFSVARALENRRNWAEAIALLETALKREPDSVTILRRLSRLCFILGRTDPAIAYGKRVLAVEPGDTETIVRLVNYYNNRRNEPTGAEAVLKEVLENPKLGPRASGRLIAEYELGKLYAGKLPNPEKAADCFAKVVDALDDRSANRLSPADQRRILGGDEAATYQQFGRAFLEAQRHELAAKAFERGLDYDPDDPELPLLLAQTLQKTRKSDRALALVEQFLKRQPQGVEGYELQAKILTELKRENEITPRLEEAAKKDSKNIALQYALADRYREVGQVEKAEALYKQLLASQPTTQGYGALASSLLKRRKAEDLIRVIADAVGRPGGIEAVQESIKGVIAEPAFAEQVLDAGAKLFATDPPGIAPPGVTVLAYIANRSNRLEKFLPIQLIQLKRNPNPQTYKEVAAVQAGLRKFADSAATLEEMMTRYPVERNPRTLAELVRLYRLADQPDRAVALARKSLEIDANDLDTLIQLATVLSETGKVDEAVDLLRAAVKREPGNPEPAAILGGILVQVGRNEEGIAAFKELLERFPNNEQLAKIARQRLSIAYVNLGDYAKGEAELEALLAKDPDDPGANNDLGYLYADQGKNLEKAEAMIRKAVAEEPDSYAYLDSLGWVLFKRGKAKEALEPLEKAVQKLEETTGTDPTIWEHLGDVYLQLKETVKARDAWRAAEKAATKSTPPDKRLPEIRKKLEALEKLGKVPRPAAGDAP